MKVHSKIQNFTSVSLPKLNNCSKSSTGSLISCESWNPQTAAHHPRPALGPVPSALLWWQIHAATALFSLLRHQSCQWAPPLTIQHWHFTRYPTATPALLSPFPHKIPLSTLHSQCVQCSSYGHTPASSPRHHLTRKRCQARSRHQTSLDGEGNCFPLVMHKTNSK